MSVEISRPTKGDPDQPNPSYINAIIEIGDTQYILSVPVVNDSPDLDEVESTLSQVMSEFTVSNRAIFPKDWEIYPVG